MRKEFTKGSQEQKMFNDFWNLCQEYWEPENTDEYWVAFSENLNEFGMKYQPFSRMLANTLRNYLLIKGGKENAKTE